MTSGLDLYTQGHISTVVTYPNKYALLFLTSIIEPKHDQHLGREEVGQWPVVEGGQSGLDGAELGVHGPVQNQSGAILLPLPTLMTFLGICGHAPLVGARA